MNEEIIKGSKKNRWIIFFIIIVGLALGFTPDYLVNEFFFSDEEIIFETDPDYALERIELKIKTLCVFFALCFTWSFYYFTKHGVRSISSKQFPPLNMTVPFDTKIKRGKSAVSNGILFLILGASSLLFVFGTIWVWTIIF